MRSLVSVALDQVAGSMALLICSLQAAFAFLVRLCFDLFQRVSSIRFCCLALCVVICLEGMGFDGRMGGLPDGRMRGLLDGFSPKRTAHVSCDSKRPEAEPRVGVSYSRRTQVGRHYSCGSEDGPDIHLVSCAMVSFLRARDDAQVLEHRSSCPQRQHQQQQ